MSNDLISRSELMKVIEKDMYETEHHKDAIGKGIHKGEHMHFLRVIGNQPTAFDVDEVIRKIEGEMFTAECTNDELDEVEIDNLLCMGSVYEVLMYDCENTAKRGNVDAGR